MNLKLRLGLALGFVLLSSIPTAAGSSPTRSSKSPAETGSFHRKLRRRLDAFDASGRPLAELLLSLAYRYKLPMGLEYVDRACATRPLHLKLGAGSLQAVITALVHAVPGYQVDFSQNLADVYAPGARNNSSDMLNAVISQFDASGEDVHRADLDLFCALVRKLNPRSGCGGSIAPGQWRTARVTLHARGKRVYELLNAIVAEVGPAIWTPVVAPESLTLPRSGTLSTLWYIYSEEAPSEELDIAIGRLRDLFPQRPAAKSR